MENTPYLIETALDFLLEGREEDVIPHQQKIIKILDRFSSLRPQPTPPPSQSGDDGHDQEILERGWNTSLLSSTDSEHSESRDASQLPSARRTPETHTQSPKEKQCRRCERFIESIRKGLHTLPKTFEKTDAEVVGRPKWQKEDLRVLDVDSKPRGATDKFRRIFGLRSLGQEYRDWDLMRPAKQGGEALRGGVNNARRSRIRLFIKESTTFSDKDRATRATRAGDRALEFEFRIQIEGGSVLFATHYEAFRILHDGDIGVVANILKQTDESGILIYKDILECGELYGRRLANCQRIYEEQRRRQWGDSNETGIAMLATAATATESLLPPTSTDHSQIPPAAISFSPLTQGTIPTLQYNQWPGGPSTQLDDNQILDHERSVGNGFPISAGVTHQLNSNQNPSTPKPGHDVNFVTLRELLRDPLDSVNSVNYVGFSEIIPEGV